MPQPGRRRSTAAPGPAAALTHRPSVSSPAPGFASSGEPGSMPNPTTLSTIVPPRNSSLLLGLDTGCLAPGAGKTRTGRLWVYVRARDDRACADPTAPAVLYRYSPDRKGEHPQNHLA